MTETITSSAAVNPTYRPVYELLPGYDRIAINKAISPYVEYWLNLGYEIDPNGDALVYSLHGTVRVVIHGAGSDDGLAVILRNRIGCDAAHALWESWLDKYASACRSARDMRSLLLMPAGRKACHEAAAAGKAYSADAEKWAMRKVVKAAVAFLQKRQSQKCPPSTVFTPNRYAAQARSRKLKRVRAALLHAADYRWACNGHTNTVQFGEPWASSDTSSDRSIYRGSFKGWSATISSHTYSVPEDWLDTVEASGLARVDGLLTLFAERIPGHGAELFRATWVEQGRGTAIHDVDGYIARIDDTTYHAATAKAALIGVRRKAGTLPKRKAPCIDLDRLAKRYGSAPVTHAHRDGIACDAGSRSWCMAVGLDFARESVTLAEIIAGYKLRPMPEALAVIRRAVKDHRQWERVLAQPRGTVRFDSEGGFRVEGA